MGKIFSVPFCLIHHFVLDHKLYLPIINTSLIKNLVCSSDFIQRSHTHNLQFAMFLQYYLLLYLPTSRALQGSNQNLKFCWYVHHEQTLKELLVTQVRTNKQKNLPIIQEDHLELLVDFVHLQYEQDPKQRLDDH